jgi:hypothetical protein
VYPDERVARLIETEFVPIRVHVKDQAADFKSLGDRYGAHWTPTILMLDDQGRERYRIEGFLPVPEFHGRLLLGLGHLAIARNDFTDAERRFEAAERDHAGSDVGAEARYWLAVSRYKSSGKPAALADAARDLASRYPSSDWAKKASVWAH